MSAQKFLFVSHDALAVDLAWKVLREGHEVLFSVGAKSEKDIGDGLLEKCDDWESKAEWADVIVFDDVGCAGDAEKWRKRGKAVIGGSAYSDRLELDRDFGQDEMRAAGMNILPNWDFESFDAAATFIREKPDRYVVKPNGKAQNEKVLSYVGQEEDGRDVIEMLEHFKRGWAAKIKSFQLQKHATGVEVAIGAFFNGKEFVGPSCVNFEHKRMCNGNIGPSTGEMGTSMFWVNRGPLYEATLGRMEKRLEQGGYRGYFDLNLIANGRGLVPLEATCRFGYPTINIQMEGVLSPWGEFLAAIARGENFNLRTKRGFQVGVVLAVPPFPFVDADAFRKYSEDAVVMFKKPVTDGFHPCDMKRDAADGDWRLAGSSGYAAVVTGDGTTMEEARREAYNKVKQILIPNMFYRTDIGERWRDDGDRLQAWGYV
ncbi:MAG: phosphoribosylamine--glycine ligase [Planctomycetes bacterium]|nr:phosphoribosylamine--glycine ligase [Planctomycetota bacterium]